MGTNVYAIIKNIHTDEVFDKYSELAKNHDIKGIEELNERISNLKSENRVHIGKRSCGWKYYSSYTKESINSFLSQCYRLENEYGEVISIEQFWKEYVDDFKNGFTGETYANWEVDRAKEKEKGKRNDPYNLVMSISTAYKYYQQAYRNNWYEAYYDGDGEVIPKDLPYRFSSGTNFC